MAQFFDDFRSAVVGAPSPDFTPMWGAGPNTVISGNPEVGSSRSVKFFHNGDGSYGRTAASWRNIQSEGKTSVRVLLSYVQHTNSPGAIVGPMLSATGSAATRSGYVVWSGANFRLSKYENGSDSSVASSTGSSANVFITKNIEIVRDGANISVWIWPHLTSRPVAPELSYTDPLPLPVSGYVGISLLLALGIRETELHSIAVGTNGDPAPTGPITPSLNTPINPSVTDLLATSARLNWEQG